MRMMEALPTPPRRLGRAGFPRAESPYQ